MMYEIEVRKKVGTEVRIAFESILQWDRTLVVPPHK